MFGLSPVDIQILLLIFVRIGGMMVTAPVLSNYRIPPQVRAGLSIILAFLLLPAVLRQGFSGCSSLWLFGLVGIKEALVGALIGYTASLIFSVVQMTGEFQDTQAGYGFAGVVDPNAGHQSAVLGQIQMVLMWMIFLILNGHHVLIRAVSESFFVLPIGGMVFHSGIAWHMAHLTVSLMLIAVRIAAPVICAVLLTDIALGVLQRTAPQLNLFAIGFQVKTTVAILVLVIAIPLIGGQLQQLLPYMGSLIKDMVQFVQ